MTPQPLPTDFVVKRTSLTWREAYWGYEHQWIDWTCLRELAVLRLDAETPNDSPEIELAGMQPSDSPEAGVLVKKLADAEPLAPEKNIQQKWLYLILRWLFENRNRFNDSLAVVEDIFCDFGHPLEMAAFIRYMPVTDGYDPQEHSKAENEDRMIQHWFEYLATAEEKFGSKPQL